tara:strand:- start:1043 stop:1255 length:213 start_codon:yes stop_codon:yes gene_type:complete
MKQTPSASARQFGGATFNFLLLVAIAAIGYSFVKKTPGGAAQAQLQGQTLAELQATLGQPVAKEQMPKPN